MTRKSVLMVLFCAALWGFCFRAGERTSYAAGTPNPCAQSTCKELYGWWYSSGTPLKGSQCYAVEKTGTAKADGTTHTTTADINIYSVVASNGTKLQSSGDADRWIYPNWNATCGIDSTTKTWQSPQEVVPTGTGGFDAFLTSRKICVP
jgi:hypothetical protein